MKIQRKAVDSVTAVFMLFLSLSATAAIAGPSVNGDPFLDDLHTNAFGPPCLP